MTTTSTRKLTVLAGLAWLTMAASGIFQIARSGDDNWELNYMVFSIALLLGAIASVVLVAQATGGGDGRSGMRIVGLAVCGLGCLACVVAWALPLWMGLLGLGFLLLAVTSNPRPRRALGLLAASQFGAIAVLIAGIEAKIGSVDEYGDYPAAGGVALVFVGGLTAVGLYLLSRRTPGAAAA